MNRVAAAPRGWGRGRWLRRTVAAASALLLASCDHPAALNDLTYTGDLAITRDIAYQPGPRHALDVYRPKAPGLNRPLIVFLYGGSWRGGSKDYYPFVAASLAHRGAVAVVPDYRIYPEALFPSFLEDNARAVAWAVAHAAEYGADSHRLFLVGHSAGAYNAAMLALDPEWLKPVGLAPGDITGVVGIAGPYDFLPITDPKIAAVFAPGGDGPRVMPITYANAHAPPMLLLVGSQDQTVGPRDTGSLARRLREVGASVTDKVYPGLGHLGIIAAFAPVLRWYAPTFRDTWQFIASHPAAGE